MLELNACSFAVAPDPPPRSMLPPLEMNDRDASGLVSN
jgi:hypothetical protein